MHQEIYQTRERVFLWDIQTQRRRQLKIRLTEGYF